MYFPKFILYLHAKHEYYKMGQKDSCIGQKIKKYIGGGKKVMKHGKEEQSRAKGALSGDKYNWNNQGTTSNLNGACEENAG